MIQPYFYLKYLIFVPLGKKPSKYTVGQVLPSYKSRLKWFGRVDPYFVDELHLLVHNLASNYTAIPV